jgi:hypothetical protein
VSSPGNELLGQVRAAAVEMLAALAHPDVDQILAGLGDAPDAWKGHALDGQLLDRIDGAALGAAVPHAGAAAMIRRLAALIGQSDAVGLFGREVPGRRLPVLAVQGGAGPTRLVALAGPRADGQPGVEVVVAGTAPAPVEASPAGGVHLTVAGNAPAPFTVTMPENGPAGLTGSAPGAELRLEVDLDPPPEVAPPPLGPDIRRGSVHLVVHLRADQPAPGVDLAVGLPGVTASLLPDLLASIVPKAKLPPFDVIIESHPDFGLVLQGDAALDVPLPGTGKSGPLDVRALGLRLGVAVDGAGPQLRLGLRADVAVEIPAAPVGLQAADLGVELGFGLTSGAPPAISAPTLGGVGVSLELPIVSGGGMLRHAPDGDWVGALALEIPPMAVAAYGVLRPPADGKPLSFLVVLSARFPQPGIQIGFGFAVSGIGGIFGLARRADVDALTGAVLDGTLSGLMFPDDPQRDAARVAAALPRLFPDAPGRVLFGPMVEINWAGGLLKGQAAVILELFDPPKFVLLGRLVLDLPTSDFALVHLEVRFLAAFDLGVPEVRIVASLTGSYIVGLELYGDLLLLIRGGPSATFVLSAGGFHPAFQPPDGIPALKRIGMSISIAIVELRYESYVAITTTSVQFGARVELTAEIAECGVHGWLGFDALFEWAPRFHFSVSITAGVEVEVFGVTIAAVRLEGLLEGPSPWHIRAHGEVEVLCVTVPITLDETFGDEPAAIDQPPDVARELNRELVRPSSWAMRPPDADRDGVLLSDRAARDVAAGRVLHPNGSLTVRQKLLPLGVGIERFGGHGVPAQRWVISGVRLRAGEEPQPPTELLRDFFALGTFRTLSVEEQLSTAAFTELDAGARLSPSGAGHADGRPTELDWETIVVGPDLTSDTLPADHLLELAALDLAPYLVDTTTAIDRPWTAAEPLILLRDAPAVIVPTAPQVGTVPGLAGAPFASPAEALDSVQLLSARGAAVEVLERWELV